MANKKGCQAKAWASWELERFVKKHAASYIKEVAPQSYLLEGDLEIDGEVDIEEEVHIFDELMLYHGDDYTTTLWTSDSGVFCVGSTSGSYSLYDNAQTTHVDFSVINSQLTTANDIKTSGVVYVGGGDYPCDIKQTSSGLQLASYNGGFKLRQNARGNSASFTIDNNGDFIVNSSTKVDNTIKFNNKVYDKNNSAGTSGQVLASTGTGVQWVNANGGGTTVWAHHINLEVTGSYRINFDIYNNVSSGYNDTTIITYMQGKHFAASGMFKYNNEYYIASDVVGSQNKIWINGYKISSMDYGGLSFTSVVIGSVDNPVQVI